MPLSRNQLQLRLRLRCPGTAATAQTHAAHHAGAPQYLFTTTYAYDAANRLDVLTQAGPAAKLKAVDFLYGVFGQDQNPNVAERRALGGQSTQVYRYDNAAPSNPDGSDSVKTSINYTPEGRVEFLKHEGRDVLEQIRTHSYSYDTKGQVTAYTSTSASNVITDNWNFARDEKKQVTAVTGSTNASFAYDQYGNRSGQVDAHYRFREDTSGRYECDAEGNVIHRWTYKDAVISPFQKNNLAVLDQLYITSDPFDGKPGRYRMKLIGITLDANHNQDRSITPRTPDSDASPMKGESTQSHQHVIKWLDGNPANFDYGADDIELLRPPGDVPPHLKLWLQFDTPCRLRRQDHLSGNWSSGVWITCIATTTTMPIA